MFRPNIFANSYTDFLSANRERLNTPGWLKITVFIENIVSWQKRLVGFANGLARFEQGRSVMKRFTSAVVAIHKADQQCAAPNTTAELFYDLEIFWNKARFERGPVADSQ